MAYHWFGYNRTGDPTLPSSYYRVYATPTCTSGCEICAIYLDDDSVGNPGPIPAEVKNYINDSLVTQVPQPSGGSNKRFVYLKSC